ncbi:MAG: TonB-dependent receptor, partial [Rhodospirillaceae bacterium]
NLSTYYSVNDVAEAEVGSTRVISRKVKSIGVSLNNASRFSFSPNADLTLAYGGEFYADDQTGRDNTTADGTRGGVPDATGRFYGAFVQAELAMRQPFGAPGVLTVIPGVRWDKFQNEATGEPPTSEDALSPKIGVSYKPVEQLLLFGNWAEAFRAPSFNETYADNLHFQIPNFQTFPPSLVSNFFITNTDLVPEESETWEVGAGVEFDNIVVEGDRFGAKMSYYKSDVTNLIDLEVNIPVGCFGAPFPPCGSGEPFGNFSRYVNVTNADIDGFELESSYDSRYFYARANFSTISGRDVATDDYVGILSPNKFFIDAGLRAPMFDIRFGSRVTIAGAFDKVNDPTEARDGYTVADIYAVWEPLSGPLKGLRLDVGVDNITDEDYEVISVGVSEPGQNYKVALSWRWAM